AIYDQLLNGLTGIGLPDEVFSRMQAQARTAQDTGDIEPGTMDGFAVTATATHHDWARADEGRHKLRQTWHAYFADYDAVLLPVTPVTAITHDHESNMFGRQIHPNGQP